MDVVAFRGKMSQCSVGQEGSVRGGGSGDEFGRDEEGRRERLRVPEPARRLEALHLHLARHPRHELCARRQPRVHDLRAAAQLEFLAIQPDDFGLGLDLVLPWFPLFTLLPSPLAEVRPRSPLGRLVGLGTREDWRRCLLPPYPPKLDVRFVIGL